MRSKLFILLIIVGSLCFYYFYNEKTIKNMVEEVSEVEEKSALTINKSASIKNDNKPSVPPITLEHEDDELSTKFDLIENAWNEKVKTFFNKQGLSRSQYIFYIKTKEKFYEESLKAYENFHNEMIKKHGEGYQFQATEADTPEREKRIQYYLETLAKNLGENNVIALLEVVDQFNDEIRLKVTKDDPLMLIDF